MNHQHYLEKCKILIFGTVPDMKINKPAVLRRKVVQCVSHLPKKQVLLILEPKEELKADSVAWN